MHLTSGRGKRPLCNGAYNWTGAESVGEEEYTRRLEQGLVCRNCHKVARALARRIEVIG